MNEDEHIEHTKTLWLLRKYYNDVMVVEERHESGELTDKESEETLKSLDDKYADSIYKLYRGIRDE